MSTSPPPDPSTPPPDNAASSKPPASDPRPSPQHGGDVNRVNIGEGAQVDQLAVGRNIFQAKINIGSLVIPVRVLLALVGVAVVLAVAVWWIVVDGKMPAGASDSNLALVEFGAKNAGGTIGNSADATYLSDWLANRLTSEVADINAAANFEGSVRPTVWDYATGFDPEHLFLKRTTSPITTEADAQAFADRVNASIVIYGNLEPGQSTSNFVPQFFVRQRVGEADELSGSQQLGQPIPMPARPNDEYLRTTLQPIGRALVWFSRGLQNDLNGRHDLAYDVLKKGQADLQDWDENQGKEVLYYFIGREALFLANCESDAALIFKPPPGEAAVPLALDTAEENFKRAQEIIAARNGRTYPRATFGLGQVSFQRAQRLLIAANADNPGQCRVNIPPENLPCPEPASPPTDPAIVSKARSELDRAIVLLDQARAERSDQARNEPPTSTPSRLDSRITGARANADILAGVFLLIQQNPAGAEPDFQNAARALLQLTQSTPAEDRRTLAVAWLNLGAAQRASGTAHLMQQDVAASKVELHSALDSLAACVKMIPTDDLDVFLRSIVLPSCTCAQQFTQNILDTIK